MNFKIIKTFFPDRTLLHSFYKFIKDDYHRIMWRLKNQHNRTVINNCSYPSSLKVGCYSYGEINAIISGFDHIIDIGNFVSIAQNVTFLLDAEHNVNTLSTFPFRVMFLNCQTEAFGKGDIIIDDDVWIGYGAIILSGVHIGQGSIIAAGSVVTSNVPPYAIVGGVPAKVIRYRFNQQVIDYLLTLDYKALTDSKELLLDHINEFYDKIDHLDINELKNKFNWFPKK